MLKSYAQLRQVEATEKLCKATNLKAMQSYVRNKATKKLRKATNVKAMKSCVRKEATKKLQSVTPIKKTEHFRHAILS